jgi:phage terminase large subunit-like protein
MAQPARELTLTFRPLPYQRIPEGDWTTAVLWGGRGIGKTWNGCRWLLTQALTYPGTTWLAVGRTWAEARRILAEGSGGLKWHIVGEADGSRPSIEAALVGGDWDEAFTRSPGLMEIRFANGSVIRFASADRPDSLRGTNAHGALGDESAFWDQSAYDMLRLAVRLPLPDGTPARLLLATTPSGMNWFYRRFIEATPDGTCYVGGDDGGSAPASRPPSTFDNPHTDAAWRSSLEAMYGGSEIGRQELYGEVLSMAGQVYKGLLPGVHTREGIEDWPTPQTYDDCIAGLDLGAENPSALVVLALKNGRWHAVAEAVLPAPSPGDVVALIQPLLDVWKPRVIVSDTNFPQTSEYLRRLRFPLRDADKRAGSVVDGISAVQQLISRNELAIDTDACPVLWREITGYRWATDRQGNPLTPERPVKADDHTLDAMRYAIYLEAGRKRQLLFS